MSLETLTAHIKHLGVKSVGVKHRRTGHFSSHLWKSFNHILKEGEDNETEGQCSLCPLSTRLIRDKAVGSPVTVVWATSEPLSSSSLEVRMKKESYQTWLSLGLLSQLISASRLRSGRSSGKSWRRTSGRPGRCSGKPFRQRPHPHPQWRRGSGGIALESEDIVGQWKENILNPADPPFIEEAEGEDSEVDSSIPQAEITGVVQKLFGGEGPVVDEICSEGQKSLGAVGLAWLTQLCNHRVEARNCH